MPLNENIDNFGEESHWATHKIHYIFANDVTLVEQLNSPQLDEFRAQEREPLQAALLVGNSYLFSIADSLAKQFNTVYMADVDPLVLQFIIHLNYVLQRTENHVDFLENLAQFLKNSSKIDPYFKQKNIITKLAKEITTVGEYHFLFNQDNFLKAKQAMKKLNLELLKIDLLNPQQVLKFKNQLEIKGEKITFANFTNLGDYYDLTNSGFSQLPFSAKPLIAYSISEWLTTKRFKSTMFCGIYTQGFNRWLKEYEIRKKIFCTLHNNAYPPKDAESKLLQKHIDLGILSGEIDCINTANAANITPFAHFASEDDIEESIASIRQLLGFQLESYQQLPELGFWKEKNKKINALLQKKAHEQDFLIALHQACTNYENYLIMQLKKANITFDLSDSTTKNKWICLKELRAQLGKMSPISEETNQLLNKYQALLELHQLLDNREAPHEQFKAFAAGFLKPLNSSNGNAFFASSSPSRFNILMSRRDSHAIYFLKVVTSIFLALSIIGILALPKIWHIQSQNFINSVKDIFNDTPYERVDFQNSPNFT